MNSDITVSELASMAEEQYSRCQAWSPRYGVVFDGTFVELENSKFAMSVVDSFAVEDGIFVMNI